MTKKRKKVQHVQKQRHSQRLEKKAPKNYVFDSDSDNDDVIMESKKMPKTTCQSRGNTKSLAEEIMDLHWNIKYTNVERDK